MTLLTNVAPERQKLVEITGSLRNRWSLSIVIAIWMFATGSTGFGAGITIITHGWVPSLERDKLPKWVFTMADAILDRADGSDTSRIEYGSVYVHDAQSGYWRVPSSEESSAFLKHRKNTDNPNQEIVLLFDWSAESDRLEEGWLEAAADALFASLLQQLPTKVRSTIPIRKPLHFIGHSRGAVLNLRVINRIGWYFPHLIVEQLTSLDPHPASLMNDPGFPDKKLSIFSNTSWADNYYRKDGYYESDSDFDGVEVEGAYNLQLDNSVLDGKLLDLKLDPGSQWEHVDTHIWYHGTIDTTALNDGTGDFVYLLDWFEKTMGPRGDIGFNYSRTVGKRRPEPQMRSKREPSRIVALFNGDFTHNGLEGGFLHRIPGWELHGGGGYAHVSGVALRELLLINALGQISRTHNWFYLPDGTTSVALDYRVGNPGANDRLDVVIDDGTRAITLESIDISQKTDWIRGRQINVPSDWRGGVCRLRVALTDAQNGTIDSGISIDNIFLIDEEHPIIKDIVPPPESEIGFSQFDVEVTFSETVVGYGSEKPDAGDLILSGAASEGVVVSSPTATGQNRWRWTLNGINREGELRISSPNAGGITDLFGHALAPRNWKYRIKQGGFTNSTRILSHPQDQIVPEGVTANFRVAVIGESPINYQWLRNGKEISGATTSMLSIASPGRSDTASLFSGLYRV